MIVLIGGTGYLGQAFAAALKKRTEPFLLVSRAQVDYTRYDVLVDFLGRNRCSFLINAAGYTGRPNVDACEISQAETLQGNTLLPLTLAHACAAVGIPWGHISSGCIYAGAKVFENGQARVAKDLMEPKLKKVREENPDAVQGFTEADEPNFTFSQPPCSFYSGTKALAEKAILGLGQNYIWRLRMPFDEFDNTRNYLSKVQRYPKVYDNVNSLSHRGDLARACLELRERQAPFGIYNVTNPGYITTRQVVQMIQRILRPARSFEFWSGDEEFYRLAAKTPRSNCVLDVSKLLAAGVKMRPVHEAVEAALGAWKKEL